jgi:DNA-binding transcriptional regulator YdaS (Cro superfamily)
MSAEDVLRQLVNDALRTADMSQAEACRRLGVSTKHLNQMLKGRAPLSLAWAERILAATGRELRITTVRRRRKAGTP